MQTEPTKPEQGGLASSISAQLKAIHIDQLEGRWITISLSIVAFMVAIITFDALVHGINPPSKVETIDSAKLHLSEEFAENNLGVQVTGNGDIVIRMVAGRYSFFPNHITVPAGTKLTFRWVSMDVLHGVHIPMTNLSTMVVPGYVAQITTTFPQPGDYPLLCNEYCGLGHNHMWSNISVVAKEDWQPPKTAPAQGAIK